MSEFAIPFNKPGLVGNEIEYIRQAVLAGQIAGDGRFTKKCESLLEEILGVSKVLLTTSCTDALEMAALLLDLQPGDEVIVPSFTFVSTANAFVLRGAKPVFIDIRDDTLNLDETQLERLVTPRTKAIIVVHYAGVGCEMNVILDIARRHNVAVVEDTAHGLFGRYRSKPLGTFGCLATLSFHETKNITCGEGGALIINDPQYIARAEIIREKGTDRSRFFRGEVDKYGWVDLGSSHLPSEILAAFLYAQLEARDEIQAKRGRLWEHYFQHLQDWAQNQDVQLPSAPAQCEQSFHMFYLLMPSEEHRQALIAQLKAHGILSVFHYLPLHLSEMGKQLGGRTGDCPVTEAVSRRLLRLPFYTSMTATEQEKVISTIVGYSQRAQELYSIPSETSGKQRRIIPVDSPYIDTF